MRNHQKRISREMKRKQHGSLEAVIATPGSPHNRGVQRGRTPSNHDRRQPIDFKPWGSKEVGLPQNPAVRNASESHYVP